MWSLFSSSRQQKRFRPNLETLESRVNPAAPAGNDLVWKVYNSATDAFKLHSNPGANQVIYMDFDGETVTGTAWNTTFNGGNPITQLPWSMDGTRGTVNNGTFSTQELDKIIELWRQVAEDFMPFDVDVTTENPGLEGIRFTGAGDTKWGMHVLIGPRPTVSNGATGWNTAGGIAYLNSFKSPNDLTCWAWNGDSSATPEDFLSMTVSHEVGHTLGLGHDGTITPAQTYYSGHGTGNVSWGPLMGAPFGKSLTQWSRNTYPSADNPEDDLALIARVAVHGFDYRPDDYGNALASAKLITKPLQAAIPKTYGIIEKNTDFDYFKINTNSGAVNITITPLAIKEANLDILAELLDASGKVIATSNPATDINATIATTLSKGTYYLRISGTGLPGATGYSNYGSLGNYCISGTVQPYTPVISSRTVLNPLRWVYNPATQTFDGVMAITYTGIETLSGKFKISIVLPNSSMTLVSPTATKAGNVNTFTYTGTFVRNQPLRLNLKVLNPSRSALPTGYNAFTVVIEQME